MSSFAFIKVNISKDAIQTFCYATEKEEPKMQTKNKKCTSLNYFNCYKQTQKPHPNRKTFNHINGNLYHYAGNNPIRYIDPDGREDDEPIVMKAYNETNSAKIEESVKASLFPNSNCEEKTINQNKEQKLLWSEASFVEGAGENSCYLQAGVYSLSSELNEKSKLLYGQVSLDFVNAGFSSSTTDGGARFGANLNIASVSGNIGIKFNLFGYNITTSIGGTAGAAAGFEGKFDVNSGVIIDFGAILKPRIEVNWRKEDAK